MKVSGLNRERGKVRIWVFRGYNISSMFISGVISRLDCTRNPNRIKLLT